MKQLCSPHINHEGIKFQKQRSHLQKRVESNIIMDHNILEIDYNKQIMLQHLDNLINVDK
jgi:hypothetical protein